MTTTRARQKVPVEVQLDPSPEFVLDADDPRGEALAALLGGVPPIVDSDLNPAPPPWSPPARNGYRADWAPKDPAGTWYLVVADVYPRMVGELREQARVGDVLRLPVDARTATDVAALYLIAEADLPEE